MPVATTDAYLAQLTPEKRATLESVRRAIRAAAPDAEEGMSYGMPAFIQGKPIAAYGAGARHCAYYPMSGAIVCALADELEGYATSKGAIRFPIGEPLPAPLIRKLVRARLAELDAAAAETRARAQTPSAGVTSRDGRRQRSGAATSRARSRRRTIER